MRQPALPTLEPSSGPGAPCKWCHQPIGDFHPLTGRRTRSDVLTCAKVCRQAFWRFTEAFNGVEIPTTDQPMRFAYADPPYPGMSKIYYADRPDYDGEVDHRELIDRLCSSYDGWALSTSCKTLAQVLQLLPTDLDHRIGAWTKPMRPGYTLRPMTAWEPVIFAGGRQRLQHLLNWVHCAPMRDYPGQITGTKPPGFSVWMFRSLGACRGDTLDDLYPGSGAVSRCWDLYQQHDLSLLDRAA